MTRINLQKKEDAVEVSKNYLEAAQRNSGFIPNLLSVLANSPQAISAYVTLSEINNKNSLSAGQREIVQITSAITNGCNFCVAGHSATVEKRKLLPEQTLQDLREEKVLPEQSSEQLAEFTRQVIATRGNVDEQHWQAFLDAGFSQQQALDVVLGVSLATLCNFANNLARTPLNTELQRWAWPK